MRLYSIGYTPDWGECKTEGMSGMGWNRFHYVPFHSLFTNPNNGI